MSEFKCNLCYDEQDCMCEFLSQDELIKMYSKQSYLDRMFKKRLQLRLCKECVDVFSSICSEICKNSLTPKDKEDV